MTGNVRQTPQERVCGPIGAGREQDTTHDGTGPQRAPEGTGDMESIDRLREWANGLHGVYVNPIDHTITVTTGWDAPPDMDSVSLRDHVNGILDGIEREVAERYVPLPVDADGVSIHVGDVVAATLAHGGSGRWVVDRMELTRAYDQDLWQIALDKDGACWVTPSTVRHHHAPTVEDVLTEMLAKTIERGELTNGAAQTIAEYAAKLTLRGDE